MIFTICSSFLVSLSFFDHSTACLSLVWEQAGSGVVLLPLIFMKALYIGAASDLPRLMTRYGLYNIINK